MSNLHHIPRLLKETKKTIDNLKPVKKKNPLVAALVGFFFGPFGIGIYLESWRDFFICLGVLILLMFTVALAPIGWIFSAAYGCYRVITSNENGGHNA
jgi:TM2 domain-containing membrane protein YozV